jgi:hypothetical protein
MQEVDSDVSKAAQKIADTIQPGIEGIDNLSASQLGKMFPQIEKIAANALQRRNFDLQEKRIEASMAKKDKPEASIEDIATKEGAKVAAREAAKEDAKFRAEGRKINRELDQDLKTLKKKKAQLLEMKKSYDKYLKDTTLPGPIGTVFGTTGSIDKDDNKMQAEFNRFALEEMGRMFEGMSKAIDSDAERRFFESTQPNIANFAGTNKDIMDRYLREVNSLISKAEEAKSVYQETMGKPETDLDPAKQRATGFLEPKAKAGASSELQDAEKWLSDNPDHPKAEAVRTKIQKMKQGS